MKILHIVPGLEEPTNGIARAAKRIAAEQVALAHEVQCVETREFVSSSTSTSNLNLSSYDVAFVHSMWLPMTIRAAQMVKAAGVKLVRMPHGERSRPATIRAMPRCRSTMLGGSSFSRVEMLMTFQRKPNYCWAG